MNNNIVGQYTVSYHYGAVIAHAVITIQAKVSETPDETPTEVPEENRPESESPGTEFPETEASDPPTDIKVTQFLGRYPTYIRLPVLKL